MDYLKPTTQTQMYEVLEEMFYYYRIRREGYAGVTLNELELERLPFTAKTEEQLVLDAQTLLASKHAEEREKYLSSLNAQIAVIDAKLNNLPLALSDREQKINDNFEVSIVKLNQAIAENGLNGSSIAVDKLAEMEVEKNRLLADVQSEYQLQNATLTAEKQTLTQKLSLAEDYLSELSQKEIQAKAKELSDEQDKIVREVFRYNNGLDEKEQRNTNNVRQANASLELRFLEIRSSEYTKDQLVQMGYYEDVINVVCDYYDTLPTLTAAQQILEDRKLSIYLDDYYQSVIYMYQERAL